LRYISVILSFSTVNKYISRSFFLQHTYNVKVATRRACIDLKTLGNI